jgi:hypothetical protein
MNALLLACGAALSACVATWALQGDQTGRIASHLGLYAVAFGAYLAGLHAAKGLGPTGVRLALGAALLWRAALVFSPPLLSDDIYRYVWEGRIQTRAGNPYAWPDRPEAEKWVPLRDEVWRATTHREYTAVYPPFWQMASYLVVATSDSVTAMKAFLVGCEVLTLLALSRILHTRGLPRERLLIMAWSPLALVEVAGSGHNDVLGLLFTVLALLALDQGRPWRSALAATLGFQSKLLPGLIACAWARRYRPTHAAGALLLAAALVAPYRSAGYEGLFMSLGKYGQYWLFNETFFTPLAALAGGHSKGVRAAALLVLLLALVLARLRVETVAAATLVVAAFLLLAPNVLPWYALWLVPLLVVRDEPAALLFTGTVGLAYLVYPVWQSGERWHVGWEVRALEYGPCLAVALASRAGRFATARRAAGM